MKLTIDGMSGEVDFEEEEPIASSHTGRTLRNGTVRVRLERTYDELMAALPGRVLESDEGQWLVLERPMHSYRDGSRVTEHVLEMEEFENRAATMLRIADLELKPEKYHEGSTRDDGVEVHARVALLEPKQIDRLREIVAADRPVPVVREGVQDAPRQMVIEVLGWSEHGAEQVYELRCKDEIQRKRAELSLRHDWRSMFANARLVAELLEWRSALGTLLLEKGILSKDEIDRLDQQAKHNVGHREIKLGQIDDVRAHPFNGEPGDD
jgi:hypothetical protein